MKPVFPRRLPRLAVMLLPAACLTVLTGCGAAGNSKATTNATANQATAASKTSTGTASVAYAASLQLVNDTDAAPKFKKATGLKYSGQGGPSLAMANLVASGEVTPNVFEGVGIAPMKAVMPKYTTWAVGFASSPIVLAYSPSSPFASQLKAIADGSKPMSSLFTLLQNPRFHLGRTDPATDPQGQDFILMMRLAQNYYHLPTGTANKILGGMENSKQIFAEGSILTDLQAGELDATTAYLPEAVQRNLPYITLPPQINLGDPADAARYATVSLTLSDGTKVSGAPIEIYVASLQGTPDTSAGVAFVSWLLSSAGQSVYKKAGYSLTPPMVYGTKTDIPQSIRSELSAK